MKRPRRQPARRARAGFALLELVIALALLSAGIIALATIFATGSQSAHTDSDRSELTAQCQSKMEALRTLNFNDSSTNTAMVNANNMFPTTGGTGLAAGGSTTAATAGYVDYLDSSGNQLVNGQNVPTSTGSIYTRLWQITLVAGASANSKTVSVRCYDTSLGNIALNPDMTFTTMVSQ